MQRLALVLIAVLVTASLSPAVAGDPVRGGTDGCAADRVADRASGAVLQSSGHTFQSSGDSYAGTHVSFGVEDGALTDYAVGGETVLASLAVESERGVAADDLVDANASLSTVTDLDGAPLDASATTGTEVRFAAESGATVAAHDNRRGVLVVASGNASNYAVADLPAGANASADGDSEVEVTTANGTEATLLVVGEGTVAVDDEGGVTARLGSDGRLVVRSYPDGKDDADETRERLIAQGTATAEVYVTAASENVTGSENASEGEQVTIDTVTYADDLAVEAAGSSDGELALAVNRTTGEGTILLASVSEDLLDASDGVEVAVDGTPAAEAATYSQLESAVGSGQSRYLVGESGAIAGESGGADGEAADGEAAGDEAAGGDAQVDAATEVSVAVNHFSERTVSIRGLATDGVATTTDDATTLTTDSDADESTTLDGSTTSTETTESGDPETTADNDGVIPGFTPITAGVSLFVVAVLCGAVAVRSS